MGLCVCFTNLASIACLATGRVDVLEQNGTAVDEFTGVKADDQAVPICVSVLDTWDTDAGQSGS